METKSIGLYIPSYKRSDKILTHKLLPMAKYVVRESEKDIYVKALGGDSSLVIGVPDNEINSLAKVRQWIIDNMPEDVIIELDDDISKFTYINAEISRELTTDEILTELEKISQIIVDLKLGHASCIMGNTKPMCYNIDFDFVALTGMVCWFNKEALKGKYIVDGSTYTKEDQDFFLQELLYNRIVICPRYLGVQNKCDTNSGGNNVNKNIASITKTVDYLKLKWGSYFDHDFNKNLSKIIVKRQANKSRFK